MLKGKPEDWLTLQRQWREQFRAEYGELRRAAAAAGPQRARREAAAGPEAAAGHEVATGAEAAGRTGALGRAGVAR